MMKNNYTVFLLYLCGGLILSIGAIQIYNLSRFRMFLSDQEMVQALFHFRSTQMLTVFLALLGVSALAARERINMELKRKVYTDVTGLKNKHACMEEMSILDCNDNTLDIGFIMFDLNNLKKVNDFYGHDKGDELILNFALMLRQVLDKKHFIGRFGGDEFIVILRNCSAEGMEDYLRQLEQRVKKYNEGREIVLSFASGYAISTKDHYFLMEDLLKEADKNMYKMKKRMKQGEPQSPQLSKILDADRLDPLNRDPLTGLLNQDAFFCAVKKILYSGRNSLHLAVVCSDIANFRYINDTYGYQTGNQILRRFADELSVQPFCLCAYRLFSDNFAFLADTAELSRDEATELINSWNSYFASTVNREYKASRFVINSGIYFIHNLSETIDDMLNYANIARKYTKGSLQNILVYKEEMDQFEKKKSEILTSFRHALENHEFKVYLQSKVRCADKNVCSCEALTRWEKQDGTLYYPDEFIPVLEQTGDIIDMDFYVYETVFAYLEAQERENRTILPIALNISRIHLTNPADFVRRVRALLNQYPVSPCCITFELTESTYMQDIPSARAFIEDLHRMGFQVSMDDFGSGYSSLKVLKDMPFDEVKFDKDFLLNEADENAQRILLQMISMVKSLNKTIVCEGVETEENVRLLERSGCDIMQGYYYHKPAPLEEWDACLKARRALLPPHR